MSIWKVIEFPENPFLSNELILMFYDNLRKHFKCDNHGREQGGESEAIVKKLCLQMLSQEDNFSKIFCQILVFLHWHLF
jgi:hypothetical protein